MDTPLSASSSPHGNILLDRALADSGSAGGPRRAAARGSVISAASKSRRSAAAPFNLMVVGHAQAGKSSFLRTLVASVVRKGGLSSASVAGGVASVAARAPSTTRSGGLGAGSRGATKVKIVWEPAATASTGSPGTPLGVSSPVPSVMSPVPSSVAGTPGPGDGPAAVPGTHVFPEAILSAPTPTAARVEFYEELTGERVSLRLIDTPGLVLPPAIHLYARQQAELAPEAAAAQDRELEAVALKWCEPILAFIDAQYEATLHEESKVRRNPKSPDFQTHACLYFLDPQVVLSSRGLTPLDRHALRKLAARLNVIPVLGKADLLTRRQLVAARKLVVDDLRNAGVLSSIFGFDVDLDGADRTLPKPAKVGGLSDLLADAGRAAAARGRLGRRGVPEDDEDDEDDEEDDEDELAAAAAELQRMMPFAIVNDESLDPAAAGGAHDDVEEVGPGGLPVRKDVAPDAPLGREYAWGTVLVESPAHCDFVALFTTLFASHIDDLKLKTRETFYEL
ncbi:hypothetical protein HK405_015381, partial [Cladochytrium tenue]